MSVNRIDKARFVGKVSKTDEGYLQGTAVVARSGILEYIENGKTILELVAVDELSKADSIDSLKMKPVTNDHPSVSLVNPQNVKQFQVGFTGENVNVDNGLLYSTITINDSAAINEIHSGKRELSCGYTCDLIDEVGTTESGERYDRRQVNRKYNHVAICDLGRAGSIASLHLDAADVYEIGTPDFKDKNKDNSPQKRSRPMPVTIKVDGIDYADQAPEVLKHIEKLDAKSIELTTKVADMTKEIGEKQTKIDAQAAQINELNVKVQEMPAQIAAAASARADLVKTASVHIDSCDALTDVQIKKAVAVKAFPTSKEKIDSLKDEDVVAISTWYDAALETLKNDSSTDTMAQNRKDANGSADRSDACSGKKDLTKEEAEAEVQNRWKKSTNRDALLK